MLTQKLAYAPSKCLPGDCYAYQNIAFSLIGDVVFAATGTFYQQEVERRIFKPLGMNDASLGLEGIEASPRWAKPHVRGRGGWVSLMPKPTYYRVAPAAGVNASIARHGAVAARARRPSPRRAARAAARDAACAAGVDAGRSPRFVVAARAPERGELRTRLARVRLRRPPARLPWRRRAGLSRR